jgi:hypothetical protein
LYPEAGEGGGCFVSAGGAGRPGVGAGDPDRAREEAARRARGKLRRYCAANRLNRFATLTYADACRDPVQLRHDVAAFFKELRGELGGAPVPYAWAPEWHPGGHGLHVHLALGRFVPRSRIAGAWPHGHFHIKLLGNLPVGSGSLGEARIAARYLAKYVAKSLDGERVPGLHRYEVAQGFQPEKVVLTARTELEVLGEASEVMGGPPGFVWRSSAVEGWRAPPACWAQWV